MESIDLQKNNTQIVSILKKNVFELRKVEKDTVEYTYILNTCELNLQKLKFNNKLSFNDNLFFLFHIYILYLDIIENAIEIMFSGNYKAAQISSHPTFICGKEYCQKSLKIIRKIITESADTLHSDQTLVNKELLVNQDLHLEFFHIPSDRKQQFDIIYNEMKKNNKESRIKNININLYFHILEILTPVNILLLYSNLYEFHKVMQAFRYLTKLLAGDENPICLPYVFNV